MVTHPRRIVVPFTKPREEKSFMAEVVSRPTFLSDWIQATWRKVLLDFMSMAHSVALHTIIISNICRTFANLKTPNLLRPDFATMKKSGRVLQIMLRKTQSTFGKYNHR